MAAGKGRTRWLQDLLIQRLPLLNGHDPDYNSWFNSLLEFMSQRGLVEPTQQKDYLSDVRNAIRVIDSNHPALEVVDFDKETWIEINNQNSDRVARRTTKFISNPDAIVKRATTLLKSYQWSEIAAGLAVVTGRRCTEVIQTAQFRYKSKYSVIFTGLLKRGNEPVECIFEIPTLCEAELVIDAIASLRTQLGEEIKSLSKRQVSRRYGKGVATKCDRYFTELVPPREDKDNLYTHLFRAVYATIASYWYCPPTIPEIEFRAAIQGHYQIIDEKNPILRRSIAAGRNYFDYKVSDGAGNIDGRLGIKLNLPDVEVIEQFQHAEFEKLDTPTEDIGKVVTVTLDRTNQLKDGDYAKSISPNLPKSKSSNSKIMSERSISSKTNSIAIPSFYLSRLEAISAKLDISTEETIQALFTWTEMGLSLAERLDVDQLTPEAIFESVEELEQLAWKASSSNQNHHSSSEVVFDRENINQICTSVRLLTEALSRQQKNSSFNNSEKISNSSRGKSPARNNTQGSVSFRDDNHKSHNPTEPIEPNLREEVSNSKPQRSHPQNEHTSSSTRKTSNRGVEAEESVNRAIDTIIEFNNAEDLPTEDRWHIGVGSLRKLTQRGDTVIRRVIESREEEIEQHHSKHKLGKWHNARGKDYPSIDEIIRFND